MRFARVLEQQADRIANVGHSFLESVQRGSTAILQGARAGRDKTLAVFRAEARAAAGAALGGLTSFHCLNAAIGLTREARRAGR